MVRYSFVFLIIAIISFLQLTEQVSVSVVPGWHTTVLSPYFVLRIFQLIWIAILPICYFLIEKKNPGLSKQFVGWHLVSTLMYFISFDGLIMFIHADIGKYLILTPLLLFALGQLLFIVRVLKQLFQQ